MASTLSPSAVHRIIFLVENDDRPIRIRKKKNTTYADSYMLKTVNYKWKTVFKLYSEVKPAPPLDYLNSLELALVFKDEVGEADVAAIFAHGKPLQFWGSPPLLLPKIVEAFNALQKGIDMP